MTAPSPTIPPEATPSGIVLYTEPKASGDGTLDPSYWDGLDVQSAGEVAESLPQPPPNDAQYQTQVEDSGSTGPGAPTITSILVNGGNVTWLTNGAPSTSQVQWTGPEEGGSPVISDLTETHSVPFTAAASGTYTITVLSRDADGNAASDAIEYVHVAAP